jgi:hypothetical protein
VIARNLTEKVIERNLTEIIIISVMNIKLKDSRRLSEKTKNRMQRVKNSPFSKEFYILPISNYGKQFSKIIFDELRSIYKIFLDEIVENVFLINNIGIM